jgi:AraC family transcriptional activator of pobA
MTRVIPNYSLYGDQALPGWQVTFDFEWIPQRSRPYNWDIRPHTHDAFLQILCLLEGSAEVQLEHTLVHAQAPCVLLIPAQTVHGFRFSSNVNGPVVTAAQRLQESMAAVVMP